MSVPEIHGSVAPTFEKVRDVFAANFEQQNEVGAAVCVYHQGRKVVDLWGGHRDQPWQEDTLVNVWSTTKGAMAACIGRLVAQGSLDLNKPVADYWPEFAASGKEKIAVAQLFSHQAGLSGPVEPVTVDDIYGVAQMADRLALQAPQWEPGTRSGYHAITIGYFAEALVSRVSGQSVGEHFHDETAGPLGLDVFMGCPRQRKARLPRCCMTAIPCQAEPKPVTNIRFLRKLTYPCHLTLLINGTGGLWVFPLQVEVQPHEASRACPTFLSKMFLVVRRPLPIRIL